MENRRMRNTFVLLLALVVALAHGNRAEDHATAAVPVTAPQANVPSPTAVPDAAQDHAKSTDGPVTTNVHTEISGKTAPNNASAIPIQIEVFYEALCGDSVKFVQYQLSPVYDELKKFINVSFIPFGQGNISKSENGTYQISCRRAGECDADKVHACAISLINDKDKLMKFVNHSLVDGFTNKTISIDECGTKSGLDKSVIDSIKSCTSDGSSFPLLEKYSKQSRENQVKTVPKIVINKNYSETTQQLSMTNLKQVVCQLIPTSDSPAECKGTVSGSSAVVVGILPLLISVYYLIRMF